MVGSTADIRITHLQVRYLTGNIYTSGDDLFCCLLISLIETSRLTCVNEILAVVLSVAERLVIDRDNRLFGLAHLTCPAVFEQDCLLREVLDDTKQINRLGVREVCSMRLAGTHSTAFFLNGFKEQVLASMETLEGVTELVAYVRTAFSLQLRHLLRIVQQRFHRIEIQRPGIDVRVDVMSRCRTVQEGLTLLPVLTHRSPVRTGSFHEVGVIRPCLLCLEDLLAFVQQLQTLIRHGGIGGDDRVLYIRLHGALQRRLFVRGDLCVTLLTSAQCYQADERE